VVALAHVCAQHHGYIRITHVRHKHVTHTRQRPVTAPALLLTVADGLRHDGAEIAVDLRGVVPQVHALRATYTHIR
jgi:hypothetical protein